MHSAGLTVLGLVLLGGAMAQRVRAAVQRGRGFGLKTF